MTAPADRLYTTEHEWVSDAAGPVARVGVTDFAQESLGDVVFLELPEVGGDVVAGEPCGEIESTKSVSTLYSPVTGKVAAVNQAAVDAPETVNADPYGAGWLFEVRDPRAADDLLDAAAYDRLVAEAA
ncbi:MAG: glycine cleavage system protein GcvH [Propionibacteriaceae bacterium]|jgi:glycine cleavage system H protein|nr:glycine cleavage system protein GcvH [Propionibacteriaceae bacterium]